MQINNYIVVKDDRLLSSSIHSQMQSPIDQGQEPNAKGRNHYKKTYYLQVTHIL